MGNPRRSQRVLVHASGEQLRVQLEPGRGRARNDYAVMAMGKSLLALVNFEDGPVKSMRFELPRNDPLRWSCVFGDSRVPRASSYNGFRVRLQPRIHEVESVLWSLLQMLPGYGAELAVDVKVIPTHGRDLRPDRDRDGRHAIDTDFAVKG